jgi:hypothetical protein
MQNDSHTQYIRVHISDLCRRGIRNGQLTRPIPSHKDLPGIPVTKLSDRRVFVSEIRIPGAEKNKIALIFFFGSANPVETLYRASTVGRSKQSQFRICAVPPSETLESTSKKKPS